MDSQALLDLTREALGALLAGWGEPRYRADQVWQWLYRRLATDPAQMTNLPGSLRQRLSAEAVIDPLRLIHEQRSTDGQTIKWLFGLYDGLCCLLLKVEGPNHPCLLKSLPEAVPCVYML